MSILDQAVNISVLLPFRFPDQDLFKKAIHSVLTQKGVTFELVLVDNGSNNSLRNIISEYQEKYSNIRVIAEEKPGISFALNKGLEFCRANYIARMDADDEMNRSRLIDQYQLLKNSKDIQVASGKVELRSSVADHRGFDFYINEINNLKTPKEIYDHRFIESPVVHPSVMFSRSLLDQYGFYSTEYQAPEDYELWLRWLSNGVKFQKIDQTVLFWNDHSSRLTRTHDNYSRSSFDRIRLQYLVKFLKEKEDESRDLIVWGAGKLAKKKIRYLEANGITIKGTIDVDINKSVSGKIAFHYKNIPSSDEIFIISMVSNRGVHNEIRNHLTEKKFIEGDDFIITG